MTFPNFKDKHLEQALFSPQDILTYRKNVIEKHKQYPSKYIICYYPYVENYFIRTYKTKRVKLWRLITIHQHKDVGLVRVTGIGAPNAATIMEELIALGGKEFINIGSAGGLVDFGVFLCEKSLRDEGTSHHYMKKSLFAYPHPALTKRFEKELKKFGLGVERAASWTIDSPYRETRAEIAKYRSQGIKTVEMESSALFAVAEFRKVKIASCFVVSDVLGEEKWNPAFDTKHVQGKMKTLVDAAVTTLSTSK